MSDTQLTVGKTYHIIWPDHYHRHQKHVGYRAIFLKWKNRHCSLHGDFIAREAVFQRVKDGGRLGHVFSVDPARGVRITEERV